MLPPTPSTSEPAVLRLPVVPRDDVDDFLQELARAAANLPRFSIGMSNAEAERHRAVLKKGTGPLTAEEMKGLSVPIVESMFDADMDPLSAAFQVSLFLVYGMGAEPESIAPQITFGRDAVPQNSERLLRGEADLSPDHERMRVATSVLHRTAALSADQFRPPVLCTLAWLMWAGGRRQLALYYTAEALRIDPADEVARRLTAQFSAGDPTWACLS